MLTWDDDDVDVAAPPVRFEVLLSADARPDVVEPATDDDGTDPDGPAAKDEEDEEGYCCPVLALDDDVLDIRLKREALGDAVDVVPDGDDEDRSYKEIRADMVELQMSTGTEYEQEEAEL